MGLGGVGLFKFSCGMWPPTSHATQVGKLCDQMTKYVIGVVIVLILAGLILKDKLCPKPKAEEIEEEEDVAAKDSSDDEDKSENENENESENESEDGSEDD